MKEVQPLVNMPMTPKITQSFYNLPGWDIACVFNFIFNIVDHWLSPLYFGST